MVAFPMMGVCRREENGASKIAQEDLATNTVGGTGIPVGQVYTLSMAWDSIGTCVCMHEGS